MNYAYDILLNFTDEDRFIEFYEWNDKDYIEHIKKIPMFYISEKDLMTFFKNNIKISKSFLMKIKNKTSSYDRFGNLEYACLFSDGNRVVGIEFNSEGLSMAKSSLLIDEEKDIIDETFDNNFIKINYEIITPDKNSFITREEILKRKYLLLELGEIKKNLEVEKLDFLYTEVFKKDNLSFDKRINKLIKEINNYNNKCNYLYDIMRLMHIKK